MEPYGLPAGTAINYKQLGFPAWVDELCRRVGLDSSTYPGHQESDRLDLGAAPNPEGLNRGIDWTGDPQRMLDFAHWLVNNAPPRSTGIYGPLGLEQVIYRHVPTGEDVWYPQWVDFSGDLPNHTDHVHTRFSSSIDMSSLPGPPTPPTPQVMTVPLVQNPDGTWASPSSAWAHLITRESGGNPTIIQQIVDVNSGGNEAEGLFQITPATWRAHGGDEFAPSARLATPQQQAIVAARIFTANPSGSDWGAGLSGRENADELAAGLVPLTAPAPIPTPTPPQPAPGPGPALTTDQKIDEIHRLLTEKKVSRSRYGDQQEWTVLEEIRNDDGFWWDEVVEDRALRGDQACQQLIEKAAAGGDRLAQEFYAKHGPGGSGGHHDDSQPSPPVVWAPPSPPSSGSTINDTIMTLAAQMQSLKKTITDAIGQGD